MGNKKLYSSQLLVIGFSILEIIATFLPAAKVYGQTFNLISPGGHMGSGVFFIVLSAIAIFIYHLKKEDNSAWRYIAGGCVRCLPIL